MLNINFLLRCGPFIRTFSPIGKPFRTVDYGSLSTAKFEELADETLESLHEYFDDLLEDCAHLPESDNMLSSGVLTVNFGHTTGTYVINKQTPNTQLWLSSPISGPKRYDYQVDIDAWIYRHDKHSLHQILQSEIPNIVQKHTNFFECKHSGRDSS